MKSIKEISYRKSLPNLKAIYPKKLLLNKETEQGTHSLRQEHTKKVILQPKKQPERLPFTSTETTMWYHPTQRSKMLISILIQKYSLTIKRRVTLQSLDPTIVLILSTEIFLHVNGTRYDLF